MSFDILSSANQSGRLMRSARPGRAHPVLPGLQVQGHQGQELHCQVPQDRQIRFHGFDLAVRN